MTVSFVDAPTVYGSSSLAGHAPCAPILQEEWALRCTSEDGHYGLDVLGPFWCFLVSSIWPFDSETKPMK